MTKQNKYRPTAAEKRLIEVLLNPENLTFSVTEQCNLANVSRNKYYDAMKKEEFCTYVSELTMDLIKGRVGDILNATYKYALTPKGHQDRKMLLTMLGMYSDKQETTIKGEMSVNNPFEGLTTEELRKLAK